METIRYYIAADLVWPSTRMIQLVYLVLHTSPPPSPSARSGDLRSRCRECQRWGCTPRPVPAVSLMLSGTPPTAEPTIVTVSRPAYRVRPITESCPVCALRCARAPPPASCTPPPPPIGVSHPLLAILSSAPPRPLLCNSTRPPRPSSQRKSLSAPSARTSTAESSLTPPPPVPLHTLPLRRVCDVVARSPGSLRMSSRLLLVPLPSP
ncbi:hypothetical protein HYPSUDRAFT_201877 [Hypholoma sublateritium FD-334 SS-4]|uniref:Uncharacterized protein n=1 Tax=Hypholoma sublateritium (strain FD-334 SS-4) TaxID=945553 RepID=A0A0D2MGN9_HYPSF|nr:hypothetical protein HYPSUDRAFT_201877 [Hypholoma sublateritium FD-334 SS-4]